LAYLKFMLGQQSMIDNTLIMGLILVLFVLFLPRGLVPAVASLLNSIFGRTKRKPRPRRMRNARHG